jgi:hypothetical protein
VASRIGSSTYSAQRTWLLASGTTLYLQFFGWHQCLRSAVGKWTGRGCHSLCITIDLCSAPRLQDFVRAPELARKEITFSF